MSTSSIVVIVVAAVVIVALAVAIRALMARRKRRQMQEQFGPEYDRVVDATGNPRKAHAVLRSRVEERDQLDLRSLDPVQRDRYSQEWRDVQAGFVDAPETSLQSADTLVTRVMRECGYPVDDFEKRTDLVSVDHPEVVRHYRAAHSVFMSSRSGRQPSTEAVRQALVSYRSLFAELLRGDDSQIPSHSRRP